ncbi:MAG: CoA ester lyase [Thaumarchaeota archaeon]|nr:CoA ester lyase [Nitrososphaerota archaeon]
MAHGFPARSWLYVPGHREKMVVKALERGPDAIIFDLEDGVPLSEKNSARDLLRRHLSKIREADRRILIRVNRIDSGMVKQDLTVLSDAVTGIVQPKVSIPRDIHSLSELLEEHESSTGINRGSLSVLPLIETAQGVLNAYQIASSSKRIAAVFFGSEDFTLDMGIKRTVGGGETRVAKSLVAIAATAAKVQAVDTIYPFIEDVEGLVKEASSAKEIGFWGKQVVHPRQIDPVNKVFTPSEEEVKEARRLVDAYEEALKQGLAVVALDGKMVEPPIAERAKKLLAVAEGIAQQAK